MIFCWAEFSYLHKFCHLLKILSLWSEKVRFERHNPNVKKKKSRSCKCSKQQKLLKPAGARQILEEQKKGLKEANKFCQVVIS